uniref:Mediator of RNA polymerase II transcription subunit 7 n=1 Tax=Strongyloides stercoralis TaxID=6248 RepID=A0A0K0EEZ8_STRER
MNSRFYQGFGRIFNNNRYSYSSKDSSSTTGSPIFYKSHLDHILYELNNFILKKVIVDREANPLDEINQYLVDLYENCDMENLVTLDRPPSDSLTRVELSPMELLQKPNNIIYYTINEENSLLNFNLEHFKEWFRNEIISILDLIELYKKSSRVYTPPRRVYYIRRSPIISGYLTNMELEDELNYCYKRVICLYSLITTDAIQSKEKRKGLFKELNFVKVLVEVLTYQMDLSNIRINNFIEDFITHYPKASFGMGQSKRLHDVVWTMEDDLAILGDKVADSLINLL